MNQIKETSLKERASYFSFFLGQNMLYFIVSQYAMLYFTDHVGIPAAVVATIFLVARIWDAVNDPIFGVIVDRSNLKKGRYKPWINLAALILPLITLLVFMVPDGSNAVKTVYISITYVLWGMAYTVSDVPGFGISMAITGNVEERNGLLAKSRLFAITGLLVVSVIIIPLSGKLGWTKAALVISAISMTLMNLVRFTLKEKHHTANTDVTVGKIVSYLIHNKYLLIYYLGITLWLGLSTGLAAINYFAIYNLGDRGLIAILMMLTIPPMILAAVIAPPIIRRIGKNTLTIGSALFGMAMLVALFFIGYGNKTLVFLFFGLYGLAAGMINVLYPMFTADCIEYGTWKTGERAAGISFSIQTFTTKLGQALATGLVGYFLAFLKYKPNMEQTPVTLKGIFSMVTLIPATGLFLMLVIFVLFYKLKDDDIKKYASENVKLELKSR
jgi:sugar (glycoside-pentoside-hexuronide) transporter